ncbi:MAG: tRNA-(ms[2]io[6]A)-hydroxylase [Gammaproteobacteria bacterium]
MRGEAGQGRLLACTTPPAWIDAAMRNQGLLLIDHANCEKKAAAAALSLMFQYGERRPEMQDILSRLAREELRHFEQVRRIMKKRGILHRMLSASRYAQGLRRHVRRREPERLLDMLIVGAFIEARSCERFQALVPQLDAELAEFYGGLAAAEARHFDVYLRLAKQMSADDLTSRIKMFAGIEASLISGMDGDFRFHSGPPA